MKKDNQKNVCISVCFLTVFALWTILICLVDVQSIGPLESSVGFATLNRFVHDLIGVHMSLYTVTDWLSLVPLGFILGFAWLGLMQWIRRKRLLSVDHSILVLGGFYMVVLAVYVLFERFPVNYRPVLIEGFLEASYPSSTTMLVLCVMPTAMMQLNARIRRRTLRRCATLVLAAFTAFMVIGRLISGVHWFTDIIGGALFSAGLVMTYHSVVALKAAQSSKHSPASP